RGFLNGLSNHLLAKANICTAGRRPAFALRGAEAISLIVRQPTFDEEMTHDPTFMVPPLACHQVLRRGLGVARKSRSTDKPRPTRRGRSKTAPTLLRTQAARPEANDSVLARVRISPEARRREVIMRVVVTAVGPNHWGLADSIVQYIT